MRERVPLRTWIAMAAALAGVAIMVGGSLGSGGLRGDALCVVMSAGVRGRDRDHAPPPGDLDDAGDRARHG